MVLCTPEICPEMIQDDVINSLRMRGYAFLPSLPYPELDILNAYFLACPVFVDAHVPQTARNRGDHSTYWRDRIRSECCCVHTDDAIKAPYLFEMALSLTDIVAEYLRVEVPVLYSANAFWTRPGTKPSRPDIHELHTDQDDVRFLAMFTMLTRTTVEEGAQELEGPDGVIRSLSGEAGTVFLADTSRRHRGLKPKHGERGIHWFRWGVSEFPPANRWDKIQPIGRGALGGRYPDNVRLRQSIRLLVH